MSLQISNKGFDSNNLIKGQYTISLFKECARIKIIDELALYKVQVDISYILKELITKYTKGQSSSVTIETAEKLIIAIWYTIDAYVESRENIEESINIIKNDSIKNMYIQGKSILYEEFENTKKLYKDTVENKLTTELIAYNDTLEGISKFFKLYNVEFEPHEGSVSIDYPLAFDDWDIKGVYYIKNYLWNMNIENRICSHFKHTEVEKILELYGKMYKIDYKELLINIFELTMTNAIFSVIIKNAEGNIGINERQYEYLNYKLSNMIEEDIINLVDLSINALIDNLKIKDNYEVEYIYKYKNSIIDTIIYSVKKCNLKSILVVNKEKEDIHYNFTIDNENKLNDKDFKCFIEGITRASNIFEKINLIKLNINSTKDFIDMLKSNCLFGKEYIDLFKSLGDIELAILGRFVLYEEYRMDKLDLKKVLQGKVNIKYEWEEYYINFMKNQKEVKIRSIEKIISSIDV